jgi:hypothetical protein
VSQLIAGDADESHAAPPRPTFGFKNHLRKKGEKFNLYIIFLRHDVPDN